MHLKKFYILAKHLLGLNTVLRGTGATSGIHLDLDGDGVVDTRIHLLQFSETGRHKSDGRDFCSGSGFSLSISPKYKIRNESDQPEIYLI